jgi:hypothetical protein
MYLGNAYIHIKIYINDRTEKVLKCKLTYKDEYMDIYREDTTASTNVS